MDSDLTRYDVYCQILTEIYGKNVVEFITKRNPENKTLYLINYSNNIEEFIRKKRNKREVCVKCKKIFNLKIKRGNCNKLIKCTLYLNRIMEFPSWAPNSPLLFKSNEPAKNLMVIGIDPGPKIRTDIHTAYELGMHEIKRDGTYDVENIADLDAKSNRVKNIKRELIEKVEILRDENNVKKLREQVKTSKNTKFWKFFIKIFDNNLDFLKDNIYITDTCKCFDDQNNLVIRNCYENYLIKEIRLIRPKIIIIQGDKPFKILKKLFNIKFEDSIKNIPKEYNFSEAFPLYFRKKLSFDTRIYKDEILDLEIIFIKVFHTGQASWYKWEPALNNSIDVCKYFI